MGSSTGLNWIYKDSGWLLHTRGRWWLNGNGSRPGGQLSATVPAPGMSSDGSGGSIGTEGPVTWTGAADAAPG